MNARVFLVVLLTATFMAVWDADQKAMNAALAKKHLSLDRSSSVVVAKCPPGLNTTQILPPGLPAADVTADSPESCIPLPRSLANGSWKVIAASGEIYSITIDRAATDSSPLIANELLEDSFAIITSAKGHRWCFVRSRTGVFSEPRSASAEINTPVK